jgi:hypothetical protein
MKAGRVLVVLSLATFVVALGGCAQLGTTPVTPKDLKPEKCPPGQCEIEVRIDGNCNITVNPELAEVADQDNVMRWVIKTDRYVFDKDGITFPFFSPFKTLKSSDPKVFRVLNRNDYWLGSSDFKYEVRIKDCKQPLDPWVRNTQ